MPSPAFRPRRRRSPYLPPGAARGCRYCFDPDSPLLRAALTQPPPNAAPLIPSESLIGDLAFLRRLMRAQYAGYPDLLQHRGFDPERFFANWMRAVRRAGDEVTFRAGVVEPLIELRQAVPDNHLTFRGADALLDKDARLIFHEYQAVLSRPGPWAAAGSLRGVTGARASTLRCAPMLRVDGSVVSIVTLSAAGSPPAVVLRRGEDSLRLDRRPATPPPSLRPADAPAYEWRAVGDTTVIALRSFDSAPAVTEHLRRFVDDYPIHAGRPRILFDLRNNGGGSLQWVHQWIARARRGDWRSYPRLEVAGALWPCSAWNLVVERQIREGRVDTPEAGDERDRERVAWAAHPPAPSARLDAGHRSGRAADPYGGRVFVLVNRHSGSSGELAAVELKRALGAIVVGERSAGTMQYGEVRRFVLPRTGLVCQLATKRFFFDEEVESVGFPVDCYLERTNQEATALVPYLDLVQAVDEERRNTAYIGGKEADLRV